MRDFKFKKKDNTSDMQVETDLKKIKQTTRKKEDENWEFRSFLKGHDIKVEELDLTPSAVSRRVAITINKLGWSIISKGR